MYCNNDAVPSGLSGTVRMKVVTQTSTHTLTVNITVHVLPAHSGSTASSDVIRG